MLPNRGTLASDILAGEYDSMTDTFRDDVMAAVRQLPEQDVRTVLDFAQFLLSRPGDDLFARSLSNHAHIQIVQTRSGGQAMIRGTRVPVHTIVGYIRLDETPESITENILPFLTLAQVHDALSYYYDHQVEIDRELAENTESASVVRLREQLGDEDFYKLTGQSE